MSENEDRPSTTDILKITAREAAGLYNMVVCLASGCIAIGLCLSFGGQVKSFLLLCESCAFSILSICAILFTRRCNLESCGLVIKGSKENHIDACKLDKIGRMLSTIAICTLMTSMVLLVSVMVIKFSSI